MKLSFLHINKTKMLCGLLLLICSGLPLAAQNKKELQDKKKKLQNDIKLTKSLLEETKQNKKQSLNQLITLNKKISIHEELINTISSEVSELDRDIENSAREITKTTEELKKLKQEYALMIRYAYKNKNAYDKLIFIFSAEDFNQAYNRLRYMQQYSEYRQQQGKRIIAKQQELSNKLAELRVQKGEKVTLAGEQQEAVQELSGEKTQQEKTLLQLQQKEKELKVELKKKQEDAARLQAAIQSIIEEEIRKAKELAAKEAAKKAAELAAKKEKEKKEKEKHKDKSVAETKTEVVVKEPKEEKEKENKTTADGLILTPEAQQLSSSFEANRSRLPWPVAEGVITSTFGVHEHPVLKNVKTKNDGVNISTKKGASVRAVFDGEITGVVSIPNAGKAIIVRHGEYLSVYTNLGDVLVKKGDKVKTKQTIGNVIIDEDDKSEMQLQIWKGSSTLDPQNWIYRN